MKIKNPKQRIKNREKKIIELCKNKRVLHIWACDSPYTEEKIKNSTLLYDKIDKVCRFQLWIDIDENSIELLNSFPNKNSRIIYYNMNDEWLIMNDETFDVIIFWETIEHLMNLETAFSSLKNFMWDETILILSTPNAYCWMSILLNMMNYDACHDDHKMVFTYKLLSQLCKANGLKVEDFYFCNGWIKLKWLKNILIYYNSLLMYYFFPQFSEWLLFILKKI